MLFELWYRLLIFTTDVRSHLQHGDASKCEGLAAPLILRSSHYKRQVTQLQLGDASKCKGLYVLDASLIFRSSHYRRQVTPAAWWRIEMSILVIISLTGIMNLAVNKSENEKKKKIGRARVVRHIGVHGVGPRGRAQDWYCRSYIRSELKKKIASWSMTQLSFWSTFEKIDT